MNKVLFFLLFLVIFNILPAKTITMEYDVPNPKVENIKNGFQNVIFENAIQTAKIGNPQLPYLPAKILLPAGHIATKVEIIKADKKILSGSYKLYPYQGVSHSENNHVKNFKQNAMIYNSDNVYPVEYNKNFTTQFLNGYSILLTSFTPLEYYPKSGKIFYYKKIKIIVETRKSDKEDAILNKLSARNSVIERVKGFVDNPLMINGYPEARARSQYDILLITSSEYQDAFSEYIQLYKKRGFITEVHTTQEIQASMSGFDLSEKIRNFIIQQYINNDILFVTLAGDVEIVPYRGFYCQVQSSQVYEDNNIPADLYYSALDGTWNDNNNELWGEPNEADLLPDISVARISFSNNLELNAILHKIISYSDNPVEGELQKPLLVGEKLWDDPLTWGGDYLDLLIGHHEDNGYTTDGIPVTDTINKLYDREVGEWSVSDLLSKIDEGTSFIHHSGHSNFNYNLRMNISLISDNIFSNVNGIDHNYTLVYSHGCVSAGFDYNDCIAEKMIDINNFAVAYIGNSRYGWFNEGTTEGPSEHLHREFVHALYSEQIGNIGTAHLQSKVASSWWVTAPGQYEEGALRWCFYDCNVLGDPVMNVWTQEPIDILVDYPSTVNLGENSINVHISSSNGNVNNLRCAIVKDNQLIGRGIADDNGDVQIDLSDVSIPGPAYLYVSGYNCKLTQFDIMFVSPDSAYPYPETYFVQTADDDTLEFGETASIGFRIKNGGNQTASNVSVSISTNDSYITANNENVYLSDINPGEEIDVNSDLLFFQISDQIPLEYTFEIQLHIIFNDNQENVFPIELTAYNTNVELQDTQIDNTNNLLLPGETVNLIIELVNTGFADLHNAIFNLSTQSSFLTIQNSQINVQKFGSQDTLNLIYTITASQNTPLGETVEMLLNISADDNFAQEILFSEVVGRIEENFETGDFSSFDWQFLGNTDWIIETDNPYEGNYCARSGIISDAQSTGLYLVYNVAENSQISFARKVSSEESYDFLNFYIDGELIGHWSGELDWDNVSYEVEAGNHIFRWIYVKDEYVSAGEDAAWIDNIIFPFSENTYAGENEVPQSRNIVKVYPNPLRVSNLKQDNFITISFSFKKSENIKLSIYNLKGETVKSLRFENIKNFDYKWDLTDKNGYILSSGIYFYKIENKKTFKIGKITIIK